MHFAPDGCCYEDGPHWRGGCPACRAYLRSYLSQREKGRRPLVSRGVWGHELGDMEKGRHGRRPKRLLRVDQGFTSAKLVGWPCELLR